MRDNQPGAIPQDEHHDGETQPMEVDPRPVRVERPTVRLPRLKDSDLLREHDERRASR